MELPYESRAPHPGDPDYLAGVQPPAPDSPFVAGPAMQPTVLAGSSVLPFPAKDAVGFEQPRVCVTWGRTPDTALIFLDDPDHYEDAVTIELELDVIYGLVPFLRHLAKVRSLIPLEGMRERQDVGQDHHLPDPSDRSGAEAVGGEADAWLSSSTAQPASGSGATAHPTRARRSRTAR